MQIQVLLFAIARERAGCAQCMVSVPEPADLNGLRAALVTLHPALEPLMPYVRFAVNETFERDGSRALITGDTVAVIPPVAGGAPRIQISDNPLDPRAIEERVAGPDSGGIVTFIGRVRDHTGDATVTRLEYEAYRPMALKVLETIRIEVETEFPTVRLACDHRVGVLAVGEIAVVVVCASPHRAAAFAACQRCIDRLKEDVPIFKREVRQDGSVWVGMGP